MMPLPRLGVLLVLLLALESFAYAPAEALTAFNLNAKSYPDNPAAQYHLGEAYRYSGQTELAVAQYRRVLQIDMGHALASSRLKQLGQ